MVRGIQNRLTWKYVRSLEIGAEGETVGWYLDNFRGLMVYPKNNRVELNSLEVYKLAYLLSLDGFQVPEELQISGDIANYFCKEILKGFISSLRSRGINISNLELFWAVGSDYNDIQEGDLFYLDLDDFDGDVLGLRFNIKGRFSKDFKGPCRIWLKTSEWQNHRDMFKVFLGSVYWWESMRCIILRDLLHKLLLIFHDFGDNFSFIEKTIGNGYGSYVDLTRIGQDLDYIRLRCEQLIDLVNKEEFLPKNR